MPDLNLPPTPYLVLDVLAARYRLGEGGWTFPRGQSFAKVLNGLAREGLIGWKSGPAGDYFAWLTDAGRAECLLDGYQSPAERELERLRQAVVGAGLVRDDYPASSAVTAVEVHLATCEEVRRA